VKGVVDIESYEGNRAGRIRYSNGLTRFAWDSKIRRRKSEGVFGSKKNLGRKAIFLREK